MNSTQSQDKQTIKETNDSENMRRKPEISRYWGSLRSV